MRAGHGAYVQACVCENGGKQDLCGWEQLEHTKPEAPKAESQPAQPTAL